MLKKAFIAAVIVATSFNVLATANNNVKVQKDGTIVDKDGNPMVPAVAESMPANQVIIPKNSVVVDADPMEAPIVPAVVTPVDSADATIQAVTGDETATKEIAKLEGDSLIVSDAWARVSIDSNNNSAVYMTINNPTKAQMTIVGASAAMVANNVELHNSFVDEKGVSRMTAMSKIVVPAETSITLMPGGMHIMLFDLKKKFMEGDKFEITLKLEGANPIISEVTVMNK